MFKKTTQLLMVTILVFAIFATSTLAADSSSDTKTYKAEDGTILTVTCLEENLDGGNYTVNLDDKVFTEVYGSLWNISGLPCRSSDSSITFSDGQLVTGYYDEGTYSIGTVGNQEGMLLTSNDIEDTSYYFVKADEEKTAQDRSALWFKILKTYKLVDTNNVTAKPASSGILVNGKAVDFDAYAIEGNNYFKLRDLAQVLSGTEKQFEVVWDNDVKAINLISGKAYTTVGGEMAKGDGNSKNAVINTSSIYKDGQIVSLAAYTIGGNNYFKLRDMGQVFDFGVTWDGVKNAVIIDTSIGYETADKSLKPQEPANADEKIDVDYSTPSLGIECMTISEIMSVSFDIPVGVSVMEVVPSGAADIAGVKRGDIIVKFDDKEVRSVEALQLMIKSNGWGDAQLLVYRDGTYEHLTVTFKNN